MLRQKGCCKDDIETGKKKNRTKVYNLTKPSKS